MTTIFADLSSTGATFQLHKYQLDKLNLLIETPYGQHEFVLEPEQVRKLYRELATLPIKDHCEICFNEFKFKRPPEEKYLICDKCLEKAK